MKREWNELRGLQVVTAKHYPDERGFLLQAWVRADLEGAGIPADFHQAIQTHSRKGVLRGLHFQWAPPMGKYVRCIHGSIIDVLVDVRHGSATLGDHAIVELTDRNHQVVWVPPGFAHGTYAFADDTIVLYECTAPHGAGAEGGIRWNDPALGIDWPNKAPIVSPKDAVAPTLAEWLADPRSKHFQIR